MRLNVGCGTNLIPGWINADLYPTNGATFIDSTKPLLYPDNSMEAVFSEHQCEHQTPHHVWDFMDECYRVLIPGGWLRIAVPAVPQILHALTNDIELSKRYCEYMKVRGWCDGSIKDTIKASIFQHGHQSVWDRSVLKAYFEAIGFTNISNHKPGESNQSLLCGLEGHGRVIGHDLNLLETLCVQGQKKE